MMRITIFVALIVLYGCSATPTTENGGLPEDLTALKQLQKDTKDEIKSLQNKLTSIEEKLQSLDTNLIRPKRLVTTSLVQRVDFMRYATIQGAVESDNIVSVSAEVGGKITSLTVDEGDVVRKGQLIATIDLDALRKQRAELETSLNLARDIFDRQQRLWDQEIGSEVQYLQARNNVDRLEKSIETLDYELTKENLYAPYSGVVDMVNLKAGETTGPGTPIIMILDTRNIKVVADVPENYLGKVTRGETVDLYFPALGEERQAKVTLLGRKIDPANRTFKIEIKIPYHEGLYKPNLLTEVRINDYTEPDVLVISQEIVQQEVGGKDFVMVARATPKGTHAEKVYIRTGESYEGSVVVTDGLTEGDQLIIDGARGLVDSEPVEIVKVEEVTSDDE